MLDFIDSDKISVIPTSLISDVTCSAFADSDVLLSVAYNIAPHIEAERMLVIYNPTA